MNNLNMVIQAVIWSSESPVSGYDIAKLIKDKTGNSHQQIYRELTKISKRNDVIIDLVTQEGKPDKKVYSFKTKEGFVTECGFVSDFSKTSVGYELLIRDVIDGTNNYDSYIKAMNMAESSFIEGLQNAQSNNN